MQYGPHTYLILCMYACVLLKRVYRHTNTLSKKHTQIQQLRISYHANILNRINIYHKPEYMYFIMCCVVQSQAVLMLLPFTITHSYRSFPPVLCFSMFPPPTSPHNRNRKKHQHHNARERERATNTHFVV